MSSAFTLEALMHTLTISLLCCFPLTNSCEGSLHSEQYSFWFHMF